MSHSHELAIIAVAWNHELGIDLEFIKPFEDNAVIAETFFSPSERAALRALPVDQRQLAFYACWTRKEAYVKAHGGGLLVPLNEFDVSLSPHEPATLLDVRGNPGEKEHWRLFAIEVPQGYVAALATEQRDWRLSTYHFCNWSLFAMTCDLLPEL